MTRPYNPDGKRMAELIQADWEKIGVKAKLITYEWGEYRKRSKTGEQHAMMFGWSGDNGDPDNFFVPLLGCVGGQGRRQRRALVQQGVRGPGAEGQAAHASRPTAPSSTRRRR